MADGSSKRGLLPVGGALPRGIPVEPLEHHPVVHEGIIPPGGIVPVKGLFGQGQYVPVAHAHAIPEEMMYEDGTDICFDEYHRQVERIGADGSRRGLPDARETFQSSWVRGEDAPPLIGDNARGPVKRQGPPVVAESFPFAKHVPQRSAGQLPETGEAREKTHILRHHPVNLGLLEHHLGVEDAVGAGSVSPGQVAAVQGVMGVHPVPEAHHPPGRACARAGSPCRCAGAHFQYSSMIHIMEAGRRYINHYCA